jgi:hypothetical protein
MLVGRRHGRGGDHRFGGDLYRRRGYLRVVRGERGLGVILLLLELKQVPILI